MSGFCGQLLKHVVVCRSGCGRMLRFFVLRSLRIYSVVHIRNFGYVCALIMIRGGHIDTYHDSKSEISKVSIHAEKFR